MLSFVLGKKRWLLSSARALDVVSLGVCPKYIKKRVLLDLTAAFSDTNTISLVKGILAKSVYVSRQDWSLRLNKFETSSSTPPDTIQSCQGTTLGISGAVDEKM